MSKRIAPAHSDQPETLKSANEVVEDLYSMLLDLDNSTNKDTSFIVNYVCSDAFRKLAKRKKTFGNIFEYESKSMPNTVSKQWVYNNCKLLKSMNYKEEIPMGTKIDCIEVTYQITGWNGDEAIIDCLEYESNENFPNGIID